MELKEIWDHILPELTKRSYRLMREADKAIKLHDEAAERMIAFVNGSGGEGKKYLGSFATVWGRLIPARWNTPMCRGRRTVSDCCAPLALYDRRAQSHTPQGPAIRLAFLSNGGGNTLQRREP